MKVNVFAILLCVGIVLCAPAFAQDKEDAVAEEPQQVQEKKDTEKPKTVDEALEQLKPDDPRKLKAELLKWKIKYYQARLRSIELEYTGLCYKDRRHNEASLQIERLNTELRRLLIP